MQDFSFHLPTKILFGQRSLRKLAPSIQAEGGKRVLLVYGGGSIKRNGIYDGVVQAMKEAGLFYSELGGIQPNPRLSSAVAGIEKIRKDQIDFILAVGGGSTIDCAKLMAAGVFYHGDPWDIVLGKVQVEKALPLGVVLTLSATGSEMDAASVITKDATKEKLGWASQAVLPRFALMDPAFTYSVNAWHTAAGTADIMSHTMENYFSVDDSAFVQDAMAEGILRTCVKYGPLAVKEPKNYEARANLMWAGTWAINGLLSQGKTQAWSVHPMEHELSAQYDITHGVGLAILTPRWLHYLLDETTAPKIARFGRQVFDLEGKDDRASAEAAIQALYDFFRSALEIPMTLRELKIDDQLFSAMAQDTIRHKGGPIQGFVQLEASDIEQIYRASLDEGVEA